MEPHPWPTVESRTHVGGVIFMATGVFGLLVAAALLLAGVPAVAAWQAVIALVLLGIGWACSTARRAPD